MPDADGKQHFLCKELGVTLLYKDCSFRYSFIVGEYSNLSPPAKAIARWVMRKLHGLRFEDKPGDIAQQYVSDVIKEVQAMCFSECGKAAIAYKGGKFERDILRKANIPHYNLEIVGCPSYNKLIDMYDVISAPTCGLHCYAREDVRVHCPVAETMLFRKWLLCE